MHGSSAVLCNLDMFHTVEYFPFNLSEVKFRDGASLGIRYDLHPWILIYLGYSKPSQGYICRFFFFKKIKVRDSRYHFSLGKSLSQLDSTFSLHSITVVTLTKLIHFVVMKRSRKEKSSWIKSETKAVANKKKIDEFHPDRRQKLAKSGKGSYFNQLSESEAAFASCLEVSAASKKKT